MTIKARREARHTFVESLVWQTPDVRVEYPLHPETPPPLSVKLVIVTRPETDSSLERREAMTAPNA